MRSLAFCSVLFRYVFQCLIIFLSFQGDNIEIVTVSDDVVKIELMDTYLVNGDDSDICCIEDSDTAGSQSLLQVIKTALPCIGSHCILSFFPEPKIDTFYYILDFFICERSHENGWPSEEEYEFEFQGS